MTIPNLGKLFTLPVSVNDPYALSKSDQEEKIGR